MKVSLPPLLRDPAEILSEGLDRRLVVLVLGGILCLGMALGLELFPHFAGRDLKTIRLAPSAGRAEPMVDYSLPEPPPAAEKELSFGELMMILSAKRGDPATAGFVSEYFASPALKGLLEDFQKGPPERPASEFVAELRKSTEFGDMMRSHSRRPAFRELAEGLTKQPQLNRLLRALRAPAPAARAASGSKFAPSDRGADTLGAEFKGRASPVGAIKAPGRPVPPDRP